MTTIERGAEVAVLGTTVVRVLHCDAVEAQADVLINSTNTMLGMGRDGTISHAFHQATEGRLFSKLKGCELPIPLGEVVVTDAFGLASQQILNIVMLGTAEEERERGGAAESRLRAISGGLRTCLSHANSQGFRSLSTPVFGVGRTIKYSMALEAIVSALRSELDKPTSLERVDITVLDEGVLTQTRRFVAAALVNASLDIGAAGDSAGASGGKGESSFVTSAAVFAPIATPTAARAAALAAVGGVVAAGLMPSPLGVLLGLGATRALLGNRRARRKPAKPAAPSPGPRGGEASSEVEHLLAERADLRVENANLVRRVKTLEELLARRDLEDRARVDMPPLGEMAQPAAFAAAMVAGDLDPLEQRESLRKGLAVLLRYLGALMLADYDHLGAHSREVNGWISKALASRLTDGGWHELILRIAQVLEPGASFFQECPGIWLRAPKGWSPLLGDLRKLVELRNEIHDFGSADRGGAESWLARALPVWKRVLAEAEPLLRYPLFSLDAISGWSKSESVSYRVRWLVGESVLPRAELIVLPVRLDPDRLYLLGPDGESALPLYPFLTYSRCEVLGTSETYSLDRLTSRSISLVTFRFSDTKDLDVAPPRWLR